MEWNLKKMWPAAAASLVAFTSLINAADDMQTRNLENRVSALESRKGSNGMINPPANPRVKEGADVIVTGEVTYWKAHEAELEYAWESDDCSGNTCPPLSLEAERPRHEFEWGFKVGLGYVLPHDGWDVYANYTRFNGHHHNCGGHECEECCVCAPRLFFPTFLIPCLTTPCPNVTEACGKWKLRLNRLDLELGREFFVSKWLTMRPFIGFAGVIITQHLNVEYAGGNYVPAGHEYEHKMRNQFRGGGLRGGFNTQWDFCKDWSIYGNLALNLLYGSFEIKQRAWDETEVFTTVIEEGECGCVEVEQVEDECASTRSLLYEAEKDFLICRPVLDLGIGLQWEHAFADDSFFLSFHAGWEQHFYWGQNQFVRFFNTSCSGTCCGAAAAYTEPNADLSLAGWVFGARFDF